MVWLRTHTTGAWCDQNVVFAANKNPFSTSETIAALVNAVWNHSVSAWIVWWQLYKHGLQSRRLAQVPVLTTRHYKKRLEFARKYVHLIEWESEIQSDNYDFVHLLKNVLVLEDAGGVFFYLETF